MKKYQHLSPRSVLPSSSIVNDCLVPLIAVEPFNCQTIWSTLFLSVALYKYNFDSSAYSSNWIVSVKLFVAAIHLSIVCKKECNDIIWHNAFKNDILCAHANKLQRKRKQASKTKTNAQKTIQKTIQISMTLSLCLIGLIDIDLIYFLILGWQTETENWNSLNCELEVW